MNVGRNTRTNWKTSKLYRLARKTLVASLVCLMISFLNVLVVVLTTGHERGLVCLTMCTLDVTACRYFNIIKQNSPFKKNNNSVNVIIAIYKP